MTIGSISYHLPSLDITAKGSGSKLLEHLTAGNAMAGQHLTEKCRGMSNSAMLPKGAFPLDYARNDFVVKTGYHEIAEKISGSYGPNIVPKGIFVDIRV